MSYAEFIVQSKSNAAAPAQREAPPKRIRTEDAVVTNLQQRESASTVQDSVERAEVGHEGVQNSEAGKDQKEGSCQKSDLNPSLGAKPVGSGSSIIVSPRQVCIKMYPDLEHSSYTALTSKTELNDIDHHIMPYSAGKSWFPRTLADKHISRGTSTPC